VKERSPRSAEYRSSKLPQIVIAASAAAVLLAAGAVYQVTRPANTASAQAAGKQAPAASRGAANPAAAKPAKAAGPPMPPSSLGANWKQKFSATFTGSKLDSSVWGTCYPWESQSGCANFGNSNEYQWYMPSQDQVRDGTLDIVARPEPTTGGAKEYSYRSGLVTTFPGYRFQYGYIEVEAKVPTATGLWSALWLAAANKQWPPEIDILEHWDAQAKYWQYYHPADAPREQSAAATADLTGWHAFGLYWDQSEVTWYIDGHKVFQAVRNVPQQPMYFLANVAVDQQSATLPSASASSLGIKSVRVWQRG
jgi:beta-glucanase (GH16 family)